MRKSAHFDTYWGEGWPSLAWLEPYFLGPSDNRWFNTGGNDGALLTAEGLEGTEHLKPLDRNRITIWLQMWGKPSLGVLLTYTKFGGPYSDAYTSVGDLRRLKEFVRSLHGDPLPVGLFIPFEEAWKAVKEFIETDGALPKSIDWIEDEKLPPETFPGPDIFCRPRKESLLERLPWI